VVLDAGHGCPPQQSVGDQRVGNLPSTNPVIAGDERFKVKIAALQRLRNRFLGGLQDDGCL
jgi:hypothetical protein